MSERRDPLFARNGRVVNFRCKHCHSRQHVIPPFKRKDTKNTFACLECLSLEQREAVKSYRADMGSAFNAACAKLLRKAQGETDRFHVAKLQALFEWLPPRCVYVLGLNTRGEPFPFRYADALRVVQGMVIRAIHAGPFVLQPEEIVRGEFVPVEDATNAGMWSMSLGFNSMGCGSPSNVKRAAPCNTIAHSC